MGLLDFASKVVVEYKADTSDMRAKLKELSAEERKLARERLEAVEAHNKGLDQSAKKVQFWAAGIGAAVGVVALASKGLDAYGKTSTQAAAAVERIKTTTSDAFNQIFAAIGQTVVALEPLINALARVAEGVAAVVSPLASEDVMDALWTGGPSAAKKVLERERAKARQDATGTMGNSAFDLGSAIGKQLGENLSVYIEAAAAKTFGGKVALKESSKGKAADPFAGYTSFGGFSGLPGTSTDDQFSAIESNLAKLQGTLFQAAKEAEDNAAAWERFNLGAREMAATLAEVQRAAADTERESFLAKLFGPVEEISVYDVALRALGDTFSSLTGALGAGFGAWIDGSQSATKAFKSFIAESLKGVAVQMAMESIKHGAFALGELAFGSFARAAMHAKAAGAFAIGAATIGSAAKAMHGAGWAGGASGGASAPAPSATSGGSGGGGQSTTTIVYADAFADSSPRARQQQAEKIVKRALGTTAMEAR